MFEQVLTRETAALLDKLKPEDLPEGTYLGGGTSVSLYLGHRRSADLDFFTPVEFVEKRWEEKLSRDLGFILLKRDWQTLIGYLDRVKISIFGYFFPQIGKTEIFRNISVASLPDLAAMKLDTLIGRETKRDFIDVYFLAQKFSLATLFSFYEKNTTILKKENYY